MDASSDEEFLLHPNSVRHVAPRTEGELPTTVPASPGALFVAGLLREVGPTQCETDAEFSVGSRLSEFHSQSQVEGVIDALQEDLEGSCEVKRTRSLLVAPADLSMPAEAGYVPQPVEVSAGGSVFPQPHLAEAERGGPVRVQNRFTPLDVEDVEADAISALSRPEEFAMTECSDTESHELANQSEAHIGVEQSQTATIRGWPA